MPFNPPASNTQSGNGANLYLLASGSGGAGDVIDGNLTVTGNIIGNGSLTIAGASNLNGAVTAVSLSSPGAVSAATVSSSGAMSCGSLSSPGAVTAATVSSSGAMSCGSLSSPGAVTAGTLSSSGGVNGATVTASGAVSCASVVASGSVSGSSFVNSSTNIQTVQIVTNGVASGGASFSGSTALLSIPIATLFPQIAKYKSFQLFLSGSSSDPYTNIIGAYSGASSVGVYAMQLQNVPVFDTTRNIRGGVQPAQYTAPASGGAITMYPDNLILTNYNLTGPNATVYVCVTANNGSTIAWNRTTPGQETNVWIYFVGIL